MLRLGDYVERCYYTPEHPQEDGNRPFNNGNARDPPLLRPRGVNRILIYPGCFNPPHKGHLQLLDYVFHNAGDDLQLIAAIIIPADDIRLRSKMRNEQNTMILPHEERIRLWRSGGQLGDRYWIFGSSEVTWAGFRTLLEEALQSEKVELKFVLLGGPDWVCSIRVVDPSSWGCKVVVTSDVSRPVDFRYPGVLCQICSCSAWEKPTFNPQGLRRQIYARMRGKSRKETEESFASACKKIEGVSICRYLHKPRGMVRFVPADPSKQPADAPSSTRILQPIASGHRSELESVVRDWALSPDLLIQLAPQYIGRGEAGDPEMVTIRDADSAQPRQIKW